MCRAVMTSVATFGSTSTWHKRSPRRLGCRFSARLRPRCGSNNRFAETQASAREQPTCGCIMLGRQPIFGTGMVYLQRCPLWFRLILEVTPAHQHLLGGGARQGGQTGGYVFSCVVHEQWEVPWFRMSCTTPWPSCGRLCPHFPTTESMTLT